MRMPKEFELKEEHLKLLKRMYIEWEPNVYDGAPAVDIKRPYGNSSVTDDVYEIINDEEFDYDEHDDMPDKLLEEMLVWHKETMVALQIVLYTQSFIPGLYRRPEQYCSRTWELVQ